MENITAFGHKTLVGVQDAGLLIIAIATIIAVGIEIRSMIEAMTVNLADLLLLFIYLEVLAMVAIYLDSGKLPVRMPLYIAIVALATSGRSGIKIYAIDLEFLTLCYVLRGLRMLPYLRNNWRWDHCTALER